MVAAYQLWVYDPFGIRTTVIDDYKRLSYARSVNAVGALTLTMAREALPDTLLDLSGAVLPDTRLEVWRRPDGGQWSREGDAPWLVQSDVRGVSERDGRYRRLTAASAMHVLSRRVVQAYPGDNRALKSGAADDVMKAFVAEALGATAGADTWTGGSASRDWSDRLTIAPNQALGPTVTKESSWRGLLPTLQELARDAATAGTPVYFDVVSAATGYQQGVPLLQFRTYIGRRGVDRTNILSGLTIAPNQALGPTVTKESSWRGLLPTLQELARDAATAGTPMFFDVVSAATGYQQGVPLLQFRTYIGRRGVDRTNILSGLILSIERGNLGGTVEVEADYDGSAAVVLAGGAGQGTHRLLAYAGDAARVRSSSYGLREAFVASTQATTQAATDAEAAAELRRRRPTRTLTGQLLSVPSAAYGVDWGFGDTLRAEFERDVFVAHVNAVTVTVEGGAEKIEARLLGDAA